MKNHSLVLGALPLTLDDVGLASLLDLSLGTIKRNVSRSPRSLPPHIRTGKKILWLTVVVLAWQKNEDLPSSINLNLADIPPVLTGTELASLLYLSPKSIDSMKFRGALPPAGRRGWATGEVFSWMVRHLVNCPKHTEIKITPPVFHLAGLPKAAVVVPPIQSLADMVRGIG